MDSDPLLAFFDYGHLPEKLQVVSKQFAALAQEIIQLCDPGEERHVAMRKLLESKDAAVRARLTTKVL